MSERKPVLFDRALKPEWVDFALDRFVQSGSEKELRDELRGWLQAKGFGFYTVSKTALQLQRTVGYRSPLPRRELEDAYATMRELVPEARRDLRLALVLKANRFLADVHACMKRAKLNGVAGLTVQELYERMQSEYGYRGMIPRRVRYALQTLVHFGVVEHTGKRWALRDGP